MSILSPSLAAVSPSVPAPAARCWCGSTRFAPSPHASYDICQGCQSARLREMGSDSAEVVSDDTAALYGSDYWEAHMAELGFPTIEERSRLDLAERCNYWLKYILKYHHSPGRALEIGCAHGGFVKLLSLAGYQAVGMEMSPIVVSKARGRFGVEIVRGPIEATNGELSSFDAIAMFDVLEHFPNPVESIAAIRSHLKPGGVLVIQTPEHQLGLDGGWRNYKPPEHTFIFTQSAAARLLGDAGLKHVAFEPALFEGDMFLFASDRPLKPATDQEITQRLLGWPDGRLVLALQDQYWRAWEMSRRMFNEPLSERYGVRGLSRELWRAAARWPRRRFSRQTK